MSQIYTAAMNASNCNELLDYLDDYFTAKKCILTSEHHRTFEEIKKRVKRFERLFSDLMLLNNNFLNKTVKCNFSQDNDTLSVSLGASIITLKFKRAHPDTPTQIPSSTEFVDYNATNEEKDIEVAKIKSDLEDKIEIFYYNANKIIKLFESLPDVKNLKYGGIECVRNNLIEHTKGIHIYSFRFSDSGPIVNPIKSANNAVHNDRGLLHNAQELMDGLLSELKRVLVS